MLHGAKWGSKMNKINKKIKQFLGEIAFFFFILALCSATDDVVKL